MNFHDVFEMLGGSATGLCAGGEQRPDYLHTGSGPSTAFGGGARV